MEICEKGLCSGCGCCEHICPRNAITMRFDDEGFLRPEIDARSCVECGLCQKKCPVNKHENHLPIEVYAAYARDKKIRKTSFSLTVSKTCTKLNNLYLLQQLHCGV